MGTRLGDAVFGEEPALVLRLEPLLAEVRALLDADVLGGEVPAHAKVAHALVAAVVGAHDLDRQPGHWDFQVGERQREDPDLGRALDRDHALVGGCIAADVGRSQAQRIHAVLEQSRRSPFVGVSYHR